MARKPKPPVFTGPPAIGTYIARSIFDQWYVAEQTGPSWHDYKTGMPCETKHGAEALAALLNDAAKVADDWRSIRVGTPWIGGDQKAWAIHCIASKLCDAIGSPQPDGLGQHLTDLHRVAADAAKDAA